MSDIRTGWEPIEVDAAGNCRWWSYRDGHGTRVVVDPATKVYVERLQSVAEAARAEVLAVGYRSSDMARALQDLYGEFWFETYVPPDPPRPPTCGYAVTNEMDDGPLTQHCTLPPHGADIEHRYGGRR